MSEGVDSGVVSAPLKSDLKSFDDKSGSYNVTTTKDGRRPKGTHPNPTIAQTISTMSLAGFTIRQVCETLKLSPETISQHYDDEMKHGRTKMMTEVVGSLAQRAVAGSDTAAIFLAKARLGWSDRQHVELSGQVEITHKTELVQELAGLLSAPNVIEGEVVDDKPV